MPAATRPRPKMDAGRPIRTPEALAPAFEAAFRTCETKRCERGPARDLGAAGLTRKRSPSCVSLREAMAQAPAQHNTKQRRRHAGMLGGEPRCMHARHRHCKVPCRAKPTCKLDRQAKACRPFYLALRLRLPHPLPAPTHRQPRTRCATLPEGQRRCSWRCTLAVGCLYGGMQPERRRGGRSEARATQCRARLWRKFSAGAVHARTRRDLCLEARRMNAHGLLQVHSACALPITAEAWTGPK